jgi:hypothetical protein
MKRYIAQGSLPKRIKTGRITSTEPNFEEVARVTPVAIPKDAVHLHWLWRKGPAALRNVVSAVALCGQISLPRDKVTSFLDDATCPICKRLAS